jgi:hypothetical protein
MTIEDFKKEHESSCNLGFKHGADMVLKLAKMAMRKDLYDTMEAAVRQAVPYREGKKQEDATYAWLEKKKEEGA